ncbi:hypothetical protein ACLKA6_005568 [Drosophila palustris]
MNEKCNDSKKCFKFPFPFYLCAPSIIIYHHLPSDYPTVRPSGSLATSASTSTPGSSWRSHIQSQQEQQEQLCLV